MSILKLTNQALDFQTEQTITQFVIPAGAGATYAATNNIATITFNAAHGLTMVPAANVPPNYFISFGGSTSAPTGTGVLVGNTFRILSIPSTTAITVYCTLSALTVTSLSGIPVFFPWLIAQPLSGFAGNVTQTISTVVTTEPPPLVQSAQVFFTLGANCAVSYYPAMNNYILDGYITPLLSGATTPATAPTARALFAASTSGSAWIDPPNVSILANGTTATSYFSVVT
jgi:hypothetical protein